MKYTAELKVQLKMLKSFKQSAILRTCKPNFAENPTYFIMMSRLLSSGTGPGGRRPDLDNDNLREGPDCFWDNLLSLCEVTEINREVCSLKRDSCWAGNFLENAQLCSKSHSEATLSTFICYVIMWCKGNQICTLLFFMLEMLLINTEKPSEAYKY